MKHRIGNFLKGIGCFVAVLGVYVFNIFMFGEVVGWGWWVFFISLTILGIVLIAKGLSPTKYELRRCVSCSTSTEQFEKKRNVKEKQSEYVCEKCGNQSIVPLCNKCKKPMVMADEQGHEWYCTTDATETPSQLMERLSKDPQYEDAFKEWWTKTFPKKPYDKEELLSWTKLYVDAGQIMFSKDGLSFTGVTEPVGKRYLSKTTNPGVETWKIEELRSNAPECRVCKKPMRLVNPPRQIWYCETDRRAFYATENRIEENAKLESLTEGNILRVTTGCPKCGGNLKEVSAGLYCFHCDLLLDRSSQPLSIPNVKPIVKDSEQERKPAHTKFCRVCGAKIPRDSTFCEKCGANIG